MNLIRSVLTVSLMLFFFTTGNSSAFEFSFGSRFLDYGNGAINLDRVTHVRPKIIYYITLHEDEKKDLLKLYSSVPTREVISNNVLNWLVIEKLEKSPFYYINISAKIFFDDFELTILEGKEFLKVPSPKQLGEKGFLFEYPTFISFLTKLSEHKKIDPKENDYYDNLFKEVNELKKEDFDRIKNGLHNTLNTYKRVVK